MTKTFEILTVRVSAETSVALDALAKTREISRAEAARLALSYGVNLAAHGFSINITRVLFILEHLGASVDVIMEREHSDVHKLLETLATKRMEQFHA
jgi:hypothetical protein